MNIVEAFQKVWAKIYNPNSVCPDVQIWDVRQFLTEILLEEVPPSLESPVSRYVYASLLLGSWSAEMLGNMWESVNPASNTCPDYNTSDQYLIDLDSLVDNQGLRYNEVADALKALLASGKVSFDSKTSEYSVVG